MKSLVLTTAPAQEPVTIAEAMAFLRVDSDDDTSLIEALIATAREVVENFTGRALVSQQWKLTLPEWPSCRGNWLTSDDARTIELGRTPLASVESVKYYPASGAAQATLDAETYYHVLTGPMPGLVMLKHDQSWPDIYDRPDAVEVNFTAGYGTANDVPRALRQCVLLMLSQLYENRAAIGNIVNEIPFSLKFLMEQQRVGGWIA